MIFSLTKISKVQSYLWTKIPAIPTIFHINRQNPYWNYTDYIHLEINYVKTWIKKRFVLINHNNGKFIRSANFISGYSSDCFWKAEEDPP